MNDFLAVRKLYKSFTSGTERLLVLVGAELEVQKGRMIAVTGASGAGKSTLLHLLGGMEKPDSGQILVGGRDVARLKGEDLARFRNEVVGFVFQFHHLLPEFTALENVMFPLLIRRCERQEARRRALERLEEVGLFDRQNHKPGQLSGGEQQRVAIARALVGEPKLLLADEPTGNLDEHTADRVYRLLLDLHRRHGLTSVLVTHNLKLAALCDQQNLLAEGQLQALERHL